MAKSNSQKHLRQEESSTREVVESKSKRGRRSKQKTKKQEENTGRSEQSRDIAKDAQVDGAESRSFGSEDFETASKDLNLFTKSSEDGGGAVELQLAKSPEASKEAMGREPRDLKPKKRTHTTTNPTLTVRKRRKVTEVTSTTPIETVKAFVDGSPPKLDSTTRQSSTNISPELSSSSTSPNATHTSLEKASSLNAPNKSGAEKKSKKVVATNKLPLGTRTSKHKRFDEEDSNDDVQDPTDRHKLDVEIAERRDTDKSVRESDEEAPEEVTTAAGEAKAKEATAHAAESVQKQAKERKEKRRKRDRELKQQASTSKKRKRSEPKENDEANTARKQGKRGDVDYDAAEELARSILESGASIPDDLPEEILAAGAREHPLNPIHDPPPVVQSKKSSVIDINKRKAKRLDAETNQVKDKKQGKRIVRVLPRESVTLPPKAMGKLGSSLREQWLKESLQRVGVPGYKRKGAKSFLRR